ncbi:MAG TPA: alkaline phosphatase family protein [Candidatus Micrarchaeia archaeon]|nr:alkaline phosphatase family protein [Candidatus Micrarchaeia archaeon]
MTSSGGRPRWRPPGSRRGRPRPSAVIAAAAAIAALGAGPIASAAAPHLPGGSGGAHRGAAAGPAGLPPIRHVFVIMLEDAGFGPAFGSPAPTDSYLGRALPSQGALLTQFYSIGHGGPLAYIAAVSGQAPNPATTGSCGTFRPFVVPARFARAPLTGDGQLRGSGCVFPPRIETVGGQLAARHLSWRAYQQDMGNDPRRDGTTSTSSGPACGHPRVGGPILANRPERGDSYDLLHDPFVFFDSVIGNPGLCAHDVVSLRPLGQDLRSVATTPNYVFISPNSCADGHDYPRCANGGAGGLGQANRFLSAWVPRIQASPAYRQGGLIIITFDEADGAYGACCGETVSPQLGSPSHPNVKRPGYLGPGGGRVGAVLLSPYIAPGTRSAVPYNHYAILRTVEELFHLPLLGDARQTLVHRFGQDVFTKWPQARATRAPAAGTPGLALAASQPWQGRQTWAR